MDNLGGMFMDDQERTLLLELQKTVSLAGSAIVDLRKRCADLERALSQILLTQHLSALKHGNVEVSSHTPGSVASFAADEKGFALSFYYRSGELALRIGMVDDAPNVQLFDRIGRTVGVLGSKNVSFADVCPMLSVARAGELSFGVTANEEGGGHVVISGRGRKP